ncbi:MAG: ribosome recycling factor [Deltaproteobacteria bacterium CG2_30_63_29]|nr:MAG: ribosome recycling factor [Deltaproteobacteria bacterium CG2_30_63_29]PJB37227.1 MAG: ribosome recycling factor [Deltaproteobacteria bacterium CG_4_9_14_3_um_filter_63_12]
MLTELIEDLRENGESTLKSLRRDLSKVRTGRANPAMLEGLKVDYYGTPTALNQVGAIKVPDPRMITIQPWEKAMISPIEKGIIASDLGLNPSNDGILIRIPIPPLTGERRRDLTKQVRDMGEKAKVALRAHRRDANDMAKAMEKDGELSEDALHTGLDKVQELVNEYVKKVGEIVVEKETEIMES